MMTYGHIFGPVPSRRLNISLGIDLVPFKTCTYDCVYCECGRTTHLTVKRAEYVPTEEVIGELEEALSGSPHIDYLTFSGSGEPTLHSGIGRIIRFLKEHYPAFRVAVLTNGSLFTDPAVRRDVLEADLIIPSLDAISTEATAAINRPHPSLEGIDIVGGLAALRSEFKGEIWLEVFIVPGINDSPEEIEKLSGAIRRIRPERVQLNTLDRPGTAPWVRPASHARLGEIVRAIGWEPVEIIAPFRPGEEFRVRCDDLAEHILTTLRRRPCTVEDLAASLGLRRSEVQKILRVLESTGKVAREHHARGDFFVTVE